MGNDDGGSGDGDGLVLHLPFDELQGTIAYDQSTFGNDAVFRGSPTWSAQEGIRGGYVEFGEGNWLEIADDDSLDLTTAMTISMWTKIAPGGSPTQSGLEKESGWGPGEYNLAPVYQ